MRCPDVFSQRGRGYGHALSPLLLLHLTFTIPVNHCAWCGSYDLGIGWQQNEAIVTFRRNGLLGNRLKYVICRNCGAVLYQYVAEPWRFPPAE